MGEKWEYSLRQERDGLLYEAVEAVPQISMDCQLRRGNQKPSTLGKEE